MTFAARTLGFSRSTIIYTFGGNTSNVSFNVTSGSVPPGTGSSVFGTYVAGSTDVKIVIGNGVYIYSTASTTPALTLTGGSGADKIELTNNGYIMGFGGNGGGSAGASTYSAPTAGGTALKAGFHLTVINPSTRYIAGGGGGGGGMINSSSQNFSGGGGGAGGGTGGASYSVSGSVFAAGGAGATVVNTNGTAGGTANTYGGSGGGGGNVLPGSASGVATISVSAGAAGGPGGSAGGGGGVFVYNTSESYSGGGGGAWGGQGGSGLRWNPATGPGSGGNGGYGSTGITTVAATNPTITSGTQTGSNAGALGGKAIDFNTFTVTVSNSGSIYGGQS